MSDQTVEVPLVAGIVGPHRESHEPRLNMMSFLAAGVTPVSGYLAFDGTGGIHPNGWGMDNNGPDKTNPAWCPNGAGCCGFAAKDHNDVAKLGDASMAGQSFSPLYATLLDAYVAYGLFMGEPGPHPDNGVSNQSFLAWLYTTGQIDGYAEIPDEFADWFTQQFIGIILGLAIDANKAGSDFNRVPRVWDAMAKLDGHDVLGIVTHADGSGALVSWGGLVQYTLAFRQTNITDRWVILDKDNTFVNWDALQGALNAVHGTVRPVAPVPAPTDHAESVLSDLGVTVKKAIEDIRAFEREQIAKWPEHEVFIRALIVKAIESGIPNILEMLLLQIATHVAAPEPTNS